jgi:hypothetical protein
MCLNRAIFPREKLDSYINRNLTFSGDAKRRNSIFNTVAFLGNRTTAVARQQILNKQQLNYNNRGTAGNGVFYSVHAKGL